MSVHIACVCVCGVVQYQVMTVVTFVLLLSGSAYVLVNGLENSKAYPYIQQSMFELITRYQWDVSARRSVDIIQEYVSPFQPFSLSSPFIYTGV